MAFGYFVINAKTNVSIEPIVDTIPLEEYPEIERGSRILFWGWLAYMTYLWTLKATAVALLHEIT